MDKYVIFLHDRYFKTKQFFNIAQIEFLINVDESVSITFRKFYKNETIT